MLSVSGNFDSLLPLIEITTRGKTAELRIFTDITVFFHIGLSIARLTLSTYTHRYRADFHDSFENIDNKHFEIGRIEFGSNELRLPFWTCPTPSNPTWTQTQMNDSIAESSST